MKSLVLLIVGAAFLLACQEDDRINQDYTGNETVYSLQQGSAYAVDGTVTFKEKTDGSTVVVVALSGTEGTIEHPVHLHLGTIAEPGADVAASLNPVLGKSGISETNLNQLSDETRVTYKELIQMNACVKIHLAASGPDRDIILAGGNVGTAAVIDASSGRSGIAVCK